MEPTRKHRNLVQNILITVLSVSAVFLFAQTQLYNLGADLGGNYLARFVSGGNTPTGTPDAGQSSLSAPVHLAVTGPFGRYGALDLTTSSETFVGPGTLLREALGSAGSFAPCEAADFASALTRPSVYYDFLTVLPLPLVAHLIGARYEGELSVRRLVLAETDSGVALYLWDGGSRWIFSTTAVTQEQLSELVGDYELGTASFAADNADLADAFAQLNPYSLFLYEPPTLPDLLAANPLTETNALLTALDFNPHNTNSRYTEKNGTQVIIEGDSSLRIQTDGAVFYQRGSAAALTIPAVAEVPTSVEAAIGVSALLSSLLGTASGDAALYLQSVQQAEEQTTLRFGYQIDGIPIRFSGGAAAAEVHLSGSTIESFFLRFRQYTATETASLLLPLRQAAAIAAIHPGAELSIGYADTGESAVQAGWLAD